MPTPLRELIDDPWFPFEGDLRVKALGPRHVPEPPRVGLVADDCPTCARPDDTYVWTDADWRLTAYRPAPIPGIVLLETREHRDSFADLRAAELAAIGPMAARVERALLTLDDVARVHVNRWGDGGAHFHLWFIPRPLGVLQLRGSMLPMWLDLLPDLPAATIDAALERIAAAMRATVEFDGDSSRR